MNFYIIIATFFPVYCKCMYLFIVKCSYLDCMKDTNLTPFVVCARMKENFSYKNKSAEEKKIWKSKWFAIFHAITCHGVMLPQQILLNWTWGPFLCTCCIIRTRTYYIYVHCLIACLQKKISPAHAHQTVPSQSISRKL